MKVKGVITCCVFSILLCLSGCASQNTSVDILRKQAYTAYQNGEYQKAAEHFTTLVEKAPEDGDYWFRLANSHARTKHPNLAIAAYQKALLLAPDNEKAWYNMGIVQMQMALKTFVDMQQYVERDSPLSRRGKDIRQELFHLLGAGSEKERK